MTKRALIAVAIMLSACTQATPLQYRNTASLNPGGPPLDQAKRECAFEMAKYQEQLRQTGDLTSAGIYPDLYYRDYAISCMGSKGFIAY